MRNCISTVALGAIVWAVPMMALAWPFENAEDRYRQAVYDLQCCMVEDAAADAPDEDDCPQVTDDGDLEEFRARDLCLMEYRKSHASKCDYDAMFDSALQVRAECTEEFGKEKCGEARRRGMVEAQEECR